jgi:predicted transcriptional regulator
MTIKRKKILKISISQKQGAFSILFNRIRGEKKDEFSDIRLLRALLSDEKARIMHIIKTQQPNSLYQLAKILNRDFKSVREDIAVLEELGFIEMIPIHKGHREKLKPLLVIDQLDIKVDI